MGFSVGEGCRPWAVTQKESKIHVFVKEKYVEDARQDEKHVLDLLEAIIQPPGLVKEELRRILFKIGQIMLKIQEFRVSSFWIPESQSFPADGQCQPARRQVFNNIWAR